MSLFQQHFNRFSETVNLQSNQSSLPTFQDLVQNTSRDLVFVCEGGAMLAYHSTIVANISSVVREVMLPFSIDLTRFFTPKTAQIFVTLAGVDPKTVRIVMDSIYGYEVLEFTKQNSHEIKSLFTSLGVSEAKFSVSNGSKNDAEDSQIVEVINGLMEEFNVNPQQTEKDLQEMLVNNLGDGYLTKMSESSAIDNGEDFFGLETLMAESGDEFDQATVEEAVDAGDSKLNVSIQNDDIPEMPDINDMLDAWENNLKFKKCFVGMSNIPNQTLKHYINIAEENLNPSKRGPDPDTEMQKRKRKKNLSPDFEYEVVSNSRSSEKVTAMNTVGLEQVNMKSETFEKISVVAASQPVVAQVPTTLKPSVAVQESVDNEIQFIEAKQVPCMICDEVFKVRSKIVQHLCQNHFSSQILELYPFVKGASCPICVKAGKPKVIQLKDRGIHVRHIGQVHEIIFDIITPAFKETIDQFVKMSKRAPPRYRVKEEKIEMATISEESNQSFNESPEDNYMKLLKDFTDNYESPTSLVEKASSLGNDSSFDDNTNESVNEEDLSQSDKTLLEKYCVDVDSKADLESQKKSLLCSLCPISSLVNFKFRSQMLSHLSQKHFYQELLSVYPFSLGQKCRICVQAGAVISMFDAPQSYVNHMGSYHENVLELLSSDLCDRIDAMPRPVTRKAEDISSFHPDINSTFNDEEVDVIEVQSTNGPSAVSSDCDLCPLSGVASRVDLLLHYTTKHFQQNLMRIYPYHEAMPCKVCVETRNPKAFVAKSSHRHLKHIGVSHEKVLAFFSVEARRKLESKYKIMKKTDSFSPEAFGASILKNVTLSKSSKASTSTTCKLCPKVFECDEDLNVHMRTHKEGKNYNCRYCGENSENAKQFKLHLLSHKNELSKSKLA